MSEETKNNNQALIDGLRKAADFLESRPGFPVFQPQRISLWAWQNKEALRDAARQLGSFTKKFTDHYFSLHKSINEAFEIEIYIDREQICKKIVKWECPDDEALLRLVEPEALPEKPEATIPEALEV